MSIVRTGVQLMENPIYSTTLETSPIEMLNIIERELSELIGAGCSQMFIQSIYDEVVGEENKLTQEAVSTIYRELHKELKGLQPFSLKHVSFFVASTILNE